MSAIWRDNPSEYKKLGKVYQAKQKVFTALSFFFSEPQ
ncbi:hypothetical protein VC87395_000143 [Vibrio paracholerae 87395]|nr:hypothetical protein VCHE09_0162 [Vibrio paracholerae HE-09]EMP95997.1 hypothetical protein VC87395_000143 [Vibrio paracholerae 87395]